MKKKTYLFALMAMALTLGSCSDNENGIGGETSKYITVSTSIGNMTRVATDANGGQTFEEGDEISVYAWTGDATVAPETRERVVNNAINKLTNGSWVSYSTYALEEQPRQALFHRCVSNCSNIRPFCRRIYIR